ncbi:exported hypothetical protein [Candidatus Zixiibacteriota bacterium]|nr:exported hypothetical protein [candidate division Zixibacteria bacterium]
MKKGIVIFYFLGLFLNVIAPAEAEEVIQTDDRFMTRKTELTLPVSPRARIAISSARHLIGKINVIADNPDQVLFQYKKVLKVPRQSLAIDYAELIDVSIEKTPTGAKLIFKAPNPAPWSGTDNSASIEGELHLPDNITLEVSAEYFDLNIVGPLRAVENLSSFGRMEVEKITERLNLSTSNQDIIATGVSGDIFLATTNADIRVENMKSGATPAQLRNQSGNVVVATASGALDIKNSYGKIRLEDIHLTLPGSRVIDSYGPIRMMLAEAKQATLEVSNTNDDVELEVSPDINASFLLSVDSDGEISAEGLMMEPTEVMKNRLRFTSGSGGADISVKISGDGNISLKGTAAGGK